MGLRFEVSATGLPPKRRKLWRVAFRPDLGGSSDVKRVRETRLVSGRVCESATQGGIGPHEASS